MPKSTFPKIDNFDKEVIMCLEQHIIPDWEKYGFLHLAIAGKTLSQFMERPQPTNVRIIKEIQQELGVGQAKRIHRRSAVQQRWPGEDQLISRSPVFNYVRDGVAEYRLGSYVVQCPQNHFLLIPRGTKQPAGETPHLEKPRHDKHCEIWRFASSANGEHVTLSICYSVENHHHNSGQYYIVSDRYAVQLYLAFAQEIESGSLYYQKTSFAILHAFLYIFLREIRSGRFYNRGVDNLPRSAQRGDSSIKMACQYIDRNLNHNLTIDVVAQAVFMARSNFTRQFREETGKTFSAYLVEKRLEQAKYWLSQESCSIDVICKFVGLKHSRFYQLFRQHFGISPSQFRRECQKNKNISNSGHHKLISDKNEV